jgi:hypothetical protein
MTKITEENIDSQMVSVAEYKLINPTTKEEHICNKVVVDGFDYYISGNEIKAGECYYRDSGVVSQMTEELLEYYDSIKANDSHKRYKVVATNKPTFKGRVVDEVYIHLKELYKSEIQKETTFIVNNPKRVMDFQTGFSAHSETHPNSDEDMINYAYWLLDIKTFNDWHKETPPKQLLEIWKSQQPKVVYFI